MADDAKKMDGLEEYDEEGEKKEEETLSGSKKQKFLSKMRKRHKRAIKADKSNREQAIEDQKFRRAGQKDQWDSDELTRRKNMMRPALVLDELSRPINQLTGEMRLNKAHIQVTPSDDEASAQTAKCYKDIIHEIEYKSEFDMIVDYAGDMQVGCGYGAWRVMTRYCDGNPFEQEAYIERVPNPLLVYLDPNAKSPVYSDAKYGFCMRRVTKDEWEDEYKGKKFPESKNFTEVIGGDSELWFDDSDGTIWIGDYYNIEPEEETFVMMENGEVWTEKEYEKKKEAWEEEQQAVLDQKLIAMQKALAMSPQNPAALGGGQPGQQPPPASPMEQAPAAGPGQPGMPPEQPQESGQPPAPAQMPGVGGAAPMQPPMPTMPSMPSMPSLPESLTIAKDKKGNEKRRTVETPKIKHYVVSADDILDGPNDVPGKFIPLVLALGIETNVEGKREIQSLIRKAKDPQKLLNQIETDKAELIGMMPKAPWIGTPEQMADFDDYYKAANVENRGWLPYRAVFATSESGAEQMVPPPQRVAMGNPPTGVFQYAQDVRNYIEDAIGMARADTMNSPSPERTGAANRGKRKASDVGTYHFIDNLNRAILHTGRILVSMIPEIYDTDRDVRTMSDDETPTFIPINTTVGNAYKRVNSSPQRYQGIDLTALKQKAKQHPDEKYNDLTRGKYDVMVKVGPPFSTAREEAAEHMVMIATQGSKMNPLDKYFMVKNLDLADGGEYSEALKRQIPPHILPPKEGEQRTPQPIPPQMQMIQAKIQSEQSKQAVDKAKTQVQMLTTRLRLMEIAKETKDSDQEVRKIVVDELNRAFNPAVNNLE